MTNLAREREDSSQPRSDGAGDAPQSRSDGAGDAPQRLRTLETERGRYRAMTPLGYHLTFNPYGQWLPGDPRGWIDSRAAAYGSPRGRPSPALREHARRLMSAAPYELSAPRRIVVAEAITEACEWRGWTLHALTVQPGHVHAVVSAAVAPEEVMRVMKSRATRRLRDVGLAAPDAPVWERHGSTRRLFTELRFRRAIRYVLDDHHRSLL